MAAIITDDFKNEIIDYLYGELDSAANNYYYIGFAKTTPWGVTDTPETPRNGIQYVNDVRDNLQSVKRVTDFSRVATRFNWSSGSVYDAYTNRSTTSNPYYVVTDENNVYLCIQQGTDSLGTAVISTTKPTGTDINNPEITAEGYVWKYMFAIGSLPASNFLSANFFPVSLADSDTAVETYELEQVDIQQAAAPGEIVGIEVTNGGTGYTTATVVIDGDGSGAAATATLSGGVVTKIEIDESVGVFDFGSGYTRATIEITGDGSGATANAVLSPLGIGGNPIHDLRATGIMYNAKIDGVEGDDFIVDNDFRQVVLVKNPKVPTTDSDFTDQSGIALKRFYVEAGYSSEPSNDDTIEGQTSGAKGIVNHFDDTNRIIWFNQDSSTGYDDFVASESLVGLSMNVDSGSPLIAPDINNQTGTIVYIDNRTPVNRSVDQIDDVKLIIKV